MSITQNTTDEQYKNADWLEQQYVAKDRSQAEIAAECGVSSSTIGRWCNKFGIEKPDTAAFDMNPRGYERWRCRAGGRYDEVRVHRLLATLKIDELAELEDKHVHHKSGVEWHNTLENVEVLTPAEHRERHAGDELAEQTV